MKKPNKKAEDNANNKGARTEPENLGTLTASLEENAAAVSFLFKDVDITLSRRFENARDGRVKFCVYYSDGVTNSAMASEHIIEPLIVCEGLLPGLGLFEQVKSRVVQANDVKASGELNAIISAIAYGDTVLLVDGFSEALIISTKNFALRGLSEPEGEKVLSGPREGFTEGIMQNLSLLRRRIRTHHLKLRFKAMGRQTGTTVCIAYMDNIVNPDILKEVERRLSAVDMDGILDSNYLVEHIAENSVLGLNTAGSTERPDVVCSRLLEGRVAILVDGSPVALTVPYLFIENFQSNEDYYMSPIYASYGRLLRALCFVLTMTVPALFVAISAYHHEIMHSSLMLNIAVGRRAVPLPAAVECFALLIIFDILRETGVRMPSYGGQALSIVGALVIGQSAVEAKLAAAPMVIIVAFTGIAILVVPRLYTASLTGRYLCLILSSTLGLLGILAGVTLFLIHLLNLKSFGVPHLTPINALSFQEVKDTFIRAPWPSMLTRIRPLTRNITRSRQKS
ncbi:MAG: spore germination protein [Oscillospiraceae bacterium]|nr:spore germination protein [Oscillospiraceae bacterium]